MLRARSTTLDNGPVKVLLISGGSGGHLIPAMTLAEFLRPEAECFFLSTSRPVDRVLSAARSEEWICVDLQPMAPLWRWLSPVHVGRQIQAVLRIRSTLERIRPDAVVGFGGLISAVGVLTARFSGIPTLLHEQNVLPGRANRWVCRLSNAVAVSFPESRGFLPRGTRVEVTGNPVRFFGQELDRGAACSLFGFDPRRPVLLIMGGSQGSRAINRLVMQMWDGFPERDRRTVQVLHLAGDSEYRQVESEYRRRGLPAKVFPFLHDMRGALCAATLAISRAGATGIAEMVALRVPSILIPYPYAGAHQRANARWLERAGGAVVLEESDLSAGVLQRETRALLDDGARLERMRDALRVHSDGSAAERLGALVKEVAA